MGNTKFTRTTKGRNQQVIVPKAVAYTVQATYPAFLANAAVGEVGVFKDDLTLKTTAIAAGEVVFIAEKMSQGTKRTNYIPWSTVTARKKLYVAPVKQVSYLGWYGTGGSLNLAAVPAAGKEYELEVLETTEATQPFPVWNFMYTAKPNDAQIDVIEALVAQITDFTGIQYKQNRQLVTAKVKASATYGNYTTAGTVTVVNGSPVATLTAAMDVAVGDYISFDAAAAPTAVIGDIYKIIAVNAGVSFTLNRPYRGAGQTFIAAEASGTRIKKVTAILQTGIEFTAINANETFVLAVRSELNNTDRTYPTYTRGNGMGTQVMELELEGDTFAGGTSKNTQFDQDFGRMELFATAAETYDYYTLDAAQDQNLVQNWPQGGKHTLHVIIPTPKSAGALGTTFNTLFGL